MMRSEVERMMRDESYFVGAVVVVTVQHGLLGSANADRVSAGQTGE